MSGEDDLQHFKECLDYQGQRLTELTANAQHAQLRMAQQAGRIERSIEGIAAHLGTHNKQIGDLQARLRGDHIGDAAQVADPTQHRYVIVSAGHVGTLEEIVRDHIRAGWQCAGGIALGQDGCHQAMVRP